MRRYPVQVTVAVDIEITRGSTMENPDDIDCPDLP